MAFHASSLRLKYPGTSPSNRSGTYQRYELFIKDIAGGVGVRVSKMGADYSTGESTTPSRYSPRTLRVRLLRCKWRLHRRFQACSGPPLEMTLGYLAASCSAIMAENQGQMRYHHLCRASKKEITKMQRMTSTAATWNHSAAAGVMEADLQRCSSSALLLSSAFASVL